MKLLYLWAESDRECGISQKEMAPGHQKKADGR